jgi:hypothetical protein
MNAKDEGLQRDFDANQIPVSNDPDVLAYKAVFNALEKEPRLNFSSAFAERIVGKIIAQRKREARRDLIWLTFGVTFLVIGLVVTAVLAGLRLEMGFLKDISAFTGIFIFGAAGIVAFNWLEKKTLLNKEGTV